MDEKEALRRTMMAARKTHFDTAGDADATALADHAAGLSGRIIAAYLPMGGELNPLPLLQALRQNKHEICLPVCIDDDAPMIFRRYKKDAPLLPDAMGISAPRATAQTVTPHSVLLPLLAFDMSGNRLGRGGGFYDRTLAHLRSETECRFIGLAFPMQKVDKCPVAPHDEALDAVLTPTGLIEF